MIGFGILWVKIVIGSIMDFIVSIGYNPFKTIYAWEAEILGNTRPGQSHSTILSDKNNVWKCFVLPGILATPTFFCPNKALITEDLPTFG